MTYIFNKKTEPDWFDWIRVLKDKAVSFNMWLLKFTSLSVLSYFILIFTYSLFIAVIMLRFNWSEDATFEGRSKLVTSGFLSNALNENLHITASHLTSMIEKSDSKTISDYQKALSRNKNNFFHIFINSLAFFTMGVLFGVFKLRMSAVLVPLILYFATFRLLTADLYNQAEMSNGIMLILALQVFFVLTGSFLATWLKSE